MTRTQRFSRGRYGTYAAAAGAMIAVGVLAGPAPVAQAGAGCDGGCSSSINQSPLGATALRNWCRSWDVTGSSTTTEPTCSSGGVNQNWMHLAPNGGHTPWDQDWDTLQVDSGWCYKVFFEVNNAPDFTRTYDRRNKGALWVKVANNANAYVKAQSSSSCP